MTFTSKDVCLRCHEVSEPPAGGRLSYLDLDPDLMASQNAKPTLPGQADPRSARLTDLCWMGIPMRDIYM
jgi:hypothetical protein